MQNQKTQCEMLLDYLHEHESITSSEAKRAFGCERLASRICDLKKLGYSIKKDTLLGKNRYGKDVHFASYRLEAPDVRRT